jgi:hypothetical protein
VAAKPKFLTREQLEGRKEKAVRFTRDVVGDPDRADEIAEESLEDYRAELADAKDQIAQLQDDNDDLQDH